MKQWAILANSTFRWEKRQKPANCWKKWLPWNLISRVLSLTLANVCFIREDYQAMEEAANKAIAIEEGNAVAHYLLGKARKGQNDDLMTIAHLTKAITLKDDFIEARLLRAEALLNLKQYKEMMEDIDAVLAQNPEEETAMLLRGKVKESNGQGEEAEEDYKLVTEINPFNEQALPLFRTTLYQSEEADGSHRTV